MRKFAIILMVAAAYAGTAFLCGALAIPGTMVSSVWPPAGIALAAVLIYGNIALPGIFLGCFIADFHLFTGNGLLIPTTLNALAPSIGGAIQAYVGRYALLRTMGTANIFNGTRTSVINATFGVSMLVLTGNMVANQFAYAWVTWWIADSVGVITIASTILAWQQKWHKKIPRIEILKVSITWVLILVLAYIMLQVHMQLYFLFIPFAIWSAFQFDIRFSLLTGLLISIVCLYATIYSDIHTHPSNPTTAILLGQLFISIIYLTILLIQTILMQRKKAYRGLQVLNQELEQRVLDRTKDLSEANLQFETQRDKAVEALEALKQSHARLMESEKMASLGLLTSGVAHEIKNPLNAMTANMDSIKSNTNHVTDIIDKAAVDESVKAQVTHAEENTNTLISATKEGINRTSGIIADLCAFARSDEPEMVSTDLNRNIDSTLNLLHSEFKSFITIIKEYGEIPPLLCHPGKINQVIMNILINAIHAMQGRRDSTITIKTSTQDSNIILSIKDNGPGMTKEVKDKVFNAFYTTKGSRGGSGLGMFISYNIIKEHYGSINVLSEPGQGTEFIITLPINGL